MAFIPVINTARCELRYTQNGQQVANIFHVEKEGPLTVLDLQDIGTALVEWWGEHLDLVSTAVTLREIDIRDLTTASGIGILWNDGLPLIGGVASPPLPNNVTLAIKWGTGLSGRSFRGRTYHVGLCESQVTQSELESAVIAPLLASYNALPTMITGSGYTLVVVSRYANNAPRPAGVTTPILNAAYADTVIDSQRRRLPGRGR